MYLSSNSYIYCQCYFEHDSIYRIDYLAKYSNLFAVPNHLEDITKYDEVPLQSNLLLRSNPLS